MTKFNNNPEFCLNRVFDRTAYFTHYDVYRLNQIFGLPSEIEKEKLPALLEAVPKTQDKKQSHIEKRKGSNTSSSTISKADIR